MSVGEAEEVTGPLFCVTMGRRGRRMRDLIECRADKVDKSGEIRLLAGEKVKTERLLFRKYLLQENLGV